MNLAGALDLSDANPPKFSVLKRSETSTFKVGIAKNLALGRGYFAIPTTSTRSLR